MSDAAFLQPLEKIGGSSLVGGITESRLGTLRALGSFRTSESSESTESSQELGVASSNDGAKNDGLVHFQLKTDISRLL